MTHPAGPGPATLPGPSMEAPAGARAVTALKYVGAYLLSMIGIHQVASSGNHLAGPDGMLGVGRPEPAPTGEWLVANLVLVGALLLWGGRRRDRVVPWIDHRQLYGIFWMGWWILFFGAFFLDPDPFGREGQCGVGGCWPTAEAITSLVFAPLLAAMAVMAVQVFLPLSFSRWFRIAPAPVVFVLATVAQLLLWPDVLLPLLSTHP